MDFQPLMEKLVAVPLRGDKRNSTNNDDYNDVPNQYRLIVRLRLALGYCRPIHCKNSHYLLFLFRNVCKTYYHPLLLYELELCWLMDFDDLPIFDGHGIRFADAQKLYVVRIRKFIPPVFSFINCIAIYIKLAHIFANICNGIGSNWNTVNIIDFFKLRAFVQLHDFTIFPSLLCGKDDGEWGFGFLWRRCGG